MIHPFLLCVKDQHSTTLANAAKHYNGQNLDSLRGHVTPEGLSRPEVTPGGTG